jgi:organic radical activating enzyme
VQLGYVSELFVSFQGEGLHVGRRHLFIRFAGCNLRCRYCDTPDSLERVQSFRIDDGNGLRPAGVNPLSADELLARVEAMLEKLGPVDGIAVTGGEPLLQAEFIAEFLAIPALPRPRLLETNGMLPDRLLAVLPYVDCVSMDLKIPSNSGEPAFWSEHARFLSLAGEKVYVKILVDDATDNEDIDRAGRLVARHAPQAPVYIQPITSEGGRVRVDRRTLSQSFEVLRSYVADVRVVPQTHKMIGIP